MPLIAILRGTISTPFEVESRSTEEDDYRLVFRRILLGEPILEELVPIPAGPFVRGTNRGGFDERPERTIYLDGFLIDRYEVTNAQYAAFVKADGPSEIRAPFTLCEKYDTYARSEPAGGLCVLGRCEGLLCLAW